MIPLSHVRGADKVRDEWKTVRAEAQTCLNLYTFEYSLRSAVTEHTLEDLPGWWRVDESNSGWHNFPLVLNGEATKQGYRFAPQTLDLMQRHLPGVRSAGFSRIGPKGWIPPHQDDIGRHNRSAVLHLGLVVPPVPHPACCLILRDREMVLEQDGHAFAFEAQVQHAAFNRSDRDRTILYVDVHPVTYPAAPSQ